LNKINLEHHGDVSDMFSKLFTPLFEGVAMGGMLDAVGFQSLTGEMNDYRLKHTGAGESDIHDISLEMVKKWFAQNKFADRIDVLTAVRFTWAMCNDG